MLQVSVKCSNTWEPNPVNIVGFNHTKSVLQIKTYIQNDTINDHTYL